MRWSYVCAWALWALLLAASFLPRRWGLAPIHWRVASSAVLVAVGWLSWWSLRREPDAPVALGIAAGMTFGALGDAWALAPRHLLPDLRLLPPMVLFGLGHVAYMAAFLRARRSLVPPPRAAWAVSCVLWAGAATAGWHYTAGVAAAPAALRWGALGYSLLLAGTPAISTALAARNARYAPVAFGGGLFLVSDLVLALGAFGEALRFGDELCWGTYGPGQMLIVFGSLVPLALGSRRA